VKENAWRTAEELMAQLARDPGYAKRRQAQEDTRQKKVAQNMRDAQPVVDDLVAQGFPITTIADLFNNKLNYEAAIPTLIQWLPRVSNPEVKEDIVRALSVVWAKPSAVEPLLVEFERADDAGLRWAVANGLAVVADDSALSRISDWLRDSRYGNAREMLAVALGNMHDSRALDLLLGLLKDEEIVGHAVIGLGNFGDPRAKNALEALRNHQKKWVRDEARTALRKLR
jgi:HEAT repeat protein